MNYDIEKDFKDYPNVRRMLEKLPHDIWGFFLPKNHNDLYKVELKIISQKISERERNLVMALQRRYGFPVRPNASLREVNIKVKIHRMKLKRQ